MYSSFTQAPAGREQGKENFHTHKKLYISEADTNDIKISLGKEDIEDSKASPKKQKITPEGATKVAPGDQQTVKGPVEGDINWQEVPEAIVELLIKTRQEELVSMDVR
ncbi:hypothetical protein NDU88_004521 [Pleurodeles waltl]|uniref:Uncharacterized protein n=1 Tax=Pleurodeles waltl TaxID=8319 RepID=A0AAV7PFA8_PLEWA|nr:hypothetical protein NDU88_004521 [Pleurodeles waltl]